MQQGALCTTKRAIDAQARSGPAFPGPAFPGSGVPGAGSSSMAEAPAESVAIGCLPLAALQRVASDLSAVTGRERTHLISCDRCARVVAAFINIRDLQPAVWPE